MLIRGDGPIPTRLMVVGDFPSLDDLHHGQPFSSSAGTELNKMLHEAGFLRSEAYVTYTHKARPTSGKLDELIAEKKKDITAGHVMFQGKHVLPAIRDSVWALWKEIDAVQPNLIITVGDLALWALTEKISSMKWRGSQLYHRTYKVIPTLNPSVVFKMWELRALILNDLRRAKRHFIYAGPYINKPEWKFIIRPSLNQVTEVISELLTKAKTSKEFWLEFDLETYITTKHIRCAGISWSRTEALCIPFTDGHENYWSTPEEEAAVVYQLYKLLTHPSVKVRGQNLLFDCQYTYRYWNFIPNVKHDTMISQHSCFSALPKGLDFLASMYADFYQFWKDEK